MLSERAKELIAKSRIVSFSTWGSQYSGELIQIFQDADDERYYLTQSNIEQICKLYPHLTLSGKQAEILREQATEIVDLARAAVLEKFPSITEPGGDLYPAFRAEACWRDFWHFLRCVSYGVAGEREDFTSAEGLANMSLLYQELKVPLPAMVCGLENLKVYSLRLFSTDETADIANCFDHLISKLKEF